MEIGKRKLIVNADDFGQSEGINRGIIEAFENGILTSASLMVRYAAAKDAAEYAKKNGMNLGIHVDLGEWIQENYEWKPLYEVVSTDDVDAVREQIILQLESFYRLMGKNPTHIDSHQHVHQQKQIKPLFLEFARKLNVNLRACNENVKYCGDFYGQSSDSSPYHEAIGPENLCRIISSLPQGITELACHPGLNIEIDTMYKYERDKEVRSLCDVSVKEKISEEQVDLCDFSEIKFA